MLKVAILICCILFNIFTYSSEQICVRGNTYYGLFVELFWAMNHLYYCSVTNQIPVIYWDHEFAYYDKNGYNGGTNCWEYYFEPVSKGYSYNPNEKGRIDFYYKETNGFCAFCWYSQYVSNKASLLTIEEQKAFKPILDHEQIYLSNHFAKQTDNKDFPIKNHPYSKYFRYLIKELLLNEYVKIKPSILAKADAFHLLNMQAKKTIGIHLRGSFVTNYEVLDVPYSYIFEEANKHAGEGVQFLVATDQEPLLEEAKKHLKGPVIFYNCERFEKTTSPHPDAKATPKMGEDVLIEMLLLSKCDHLVHTLSNVSTAALYFNPELEHTVIY